MIDGFRRLFSAHQLPNVFYQTLSRRASHVIDRGIKQVTLGWVGSPNQRDAFGVHDAIRVLSITVKT